MTMNLSVLNCSATKSFGGGLKEVIIWVDGLYITIVSIEFDSKAFVDDKSWILNSHFKFSTIILHGKTSMQFFLKFRVSFF